MPDVLTLVGYGVLAVVVICGGAFLYEMKKTGRTATQELAAIQSNPTVVAAQATASADIASLKTWLATETADIKAKINASTAIAPPVVGQKFINIYEIGYAMGGAQAQNSVEIDKILVWSGTQPPRTFTTLVPLAPGAPTQIVCES